MEQGIDGDAKQMTIYIAVAVIAVLTSVLLLKLAFGRQIPVRDLNELVAQSEPVDLAAFRNLIDSGEEEYLRANLAPAEFREIQRARMRAALQYVERTAHNSALLVRIGQASRHHPNPETARAAEKLANDALQLRLFSMLAVGYFYCRILAPTARFGSSSFVDRYEHLRDSMARLARLQAPTLVSRVESAL